MCELQQIACGNMCVKEFEQSYTCNILYKEVFISFKGRIWMIRFGTGGWRAIIGDDFVKENVYKVGQAVYE